MSLEDFPRFMESLSPDKEEAGRLYIRLQEKLVGFFGMRGISDSTGATNETLKRGAEKIAGGTNVPNAEKFCLGIARNVAREWWRRERREEVAFRRFTENLANNTADEVERIEHVLKPCFERLKGEDQKLLVAYCSVAEGVSHAERRRRVAEELEITMRALRIKVSRLRDKLEECVKERLKNG